MLMKKWKEKLSDAACAALYEIYRKIHFSELFAFQVKATTARDKSLLRNWCHKFRHLNIPAAVVQQCCQLFWEILVKTIFSIILPAFLKHVLLSYFYHSKSYGLRTSHTEPLCRLVVGKEASTVSTLHGITDCVKSGTSRKLVSFNRCQRLATVSPTTPSGQVWESCSQHFKKQKLNSEN